MGGWWRWALVSPDGVAPSRMVNASASVNLPLHHKVQKFSSGTGSPGWSRIKGRKTVVVVVFLITLATAENKNQTRVQRCFTKHKPHASRQKGKTCHFLPLVTLTSKFVCTRDKNVFCVNLVHIRSAAPEIFHTQPKKPQTDGAKNRTFCSSLHAIIVQHN